VTVLIFLVIITEVKFLYLGAYKCHSAEYVQKVKSI